MGAVVYLGHVPYGFFEEQIRGFFSQFGSVGRLRLSRSPKTANPRGYAFIEFHDLDCAEIVVETMNNYLLYGRILRCAFRFASYSLLFLLLLVTHLMHFFFELIYFL
jgi:RNA recognition motif-containing protein